MNWTQLLEETLGGIGIYAIFKTSHIAVVAGMASEAQKKLVSSFSEVLSEYKTKALLQQIQAEAAVIEEQQQQFDKKWGYLLQGDSKLERK